MRTLAIAVVAMAWLVPVAEAREPDAPDDPPERVLIEAQGGYGLQIGNTPFIPQGEGDPFDHPITNGPALGGAAGLRIVPRLFATLTYRFTAAHSRDGEIPGVLDEIEGSIAYHTLTAGIRPYVRVGPGSLLAEFGVGVLFPFATRLGYDYGDSLSQLPTPITGSGEQITGYNLGFGGTGLLGYQLPIAERLYSALHLRVATFSTDNNGRETELRNFVPDLAAAPPTPVTTVTEPDDDSELRPTTYAVSDFRAQLALGFQF